MVLPMVTAGPVGELPLGPTIVMVPAELNTEPPELLEIDPVTRSAPLPAVRLTRPPLPTADDESILPVTVSALLALTATPLEPAPEVVDVIRLPVVVIDRKDM